MKRILTAIFILGLSLAGAPAQDEATQEQLNKLKGSVQDLIEMQRSQAKRLDALEKEINDLRDKAGGTGANAEDLQKLADQVQEIEKKRQADKELILKELEKLGKTGGSTSGRKSTPIVSTNPPPGGASSGGKQTGYEYSVQRNDTLSIIAKAYRDQGIKVTADQILKANPGLNPNNLKVGQKIFIPAPAQ
ncbi:MAG TPA: LysM domain-containing protein [Candidatus Acidoferrum sp.]|nr:LysM domain-containing protein [Candidatus Acidoferrum sp.]